MEDNLSWKATFYERQLFKEDSLLWYFVMDGRGPSPEEDQPKTITIDERLIKVENNL